MRPTRVLFVLTSPVRGGVEEVVLALLRRLDPSQFRLALAAPRALLDAFGGELDGLPVDTAAVAADSWLRPGEVDRLRRLMRQLCPDVVNPHLFRSTAVAAPLAKWLGVPAVIETYHGREGWRRGPLRGAFLPDRIVGHFIDRVIAVSNAAAAFLVRGKGYPAHKITVIPNGRDLSVFRPGRYGRAMRHELGLPHDDPVVGVVGRLETQKGHVHLLEAWALVRRHVPTARLLVVGEGSLRGELQRRAGDLGVGESVVFAGFRADVAPILEAVDVLALPSLYEGMPLTAIEASAMARPVVATAVDGTPEVIRDGVTGRLVAPGDVQALADSIIALLHDPEAARRLGAAARAWVLDRFDLDTQVEATARVYRGAAAPAIGVAA